MYFFLKIENIIDSVFKQLYEISIECHEFGIASLYLLIIYGNFSEFKIPQPLNLDILCEKFKEYINICLCETNKN